MACATTKKTIGRPRRSGSDDLRDLRDCSRAARITAYNRAVLRLQDAIRDLGAEAHRSVAVKGRPAPTAGARRAAERLARLVGELPLIG